MIWIQWNGYTETMKGTAMKKKTLILTAAAAVLLIATAVFCGLKFIRYERAQNENIKFLTQRVLELSEDLGDLSDAYRMDQEYYEHGHSWGKGYNWLAIGNSITLIEAFGRGICSTRPDNDYFGIVKAHLETKYPDVDAFRVNVVPWEKKSSNRSTRLYLIDPYLSPALDLVTVQLGENVYDTTTYQEDLAGMIRHIRDICPNTQIILIDDFWEQEISDLRKAAAAETGTAFADLSEIRGKAEYQSKEGTVFQLPDGSTETVSKAAETHPGDAGMKYIADQIIRLLP